MLALLPRVIQKFESRAVEHNKELLMTSTDCSANLLQAMEFFRTSVQLDRGDCVPLDNLLGREVTATYDRTVDEIGQDRLTLREKSSIINRYVQQLFSIATSVDVKKVEFTPAENRVVFHCWTTITYDTTNPDYIGPPAADFDDTTTLFFDHNHLIQKIYSLIFRENLSEAP
jgi:hypothetical protein